MMNSRRRFLMQTQKQPLETFVVYDYDSAPSAINGSVVTGSYTELGNKGITLRTQGSGSVSCALGTYDLSGFTKLKFIAAVKDYAISAVNISVNSNGGLKTSNFAESIAANEVSTFTAANGSYSTHYLDITGAGKNGTLSLSLTAGGTTQISLVAFKYIAFLPEGEDGGTTPADDTLTVTGTGNQTTGYITVDGTKIWSTTVLSLAGGGHNLFATAYKIVIDGVEHTASDTDGLTSISVAVSGSITVNIEEETAEGAFGLSSYNYYIITIT